MKNILNSSLLQWLLALAIIAVVGAGAFQYYITTQELATVRGQLNSTAEAYQDSRREIKQLKEDKRQLREQVASLRQENDRFEEQIEDIAEKVGTLEKIQRIDEELLKKYSKVFFLSDNYVPGDFEKIDEEYVYRDEDEHIHAEVWPFLEELLQDAENDGIDLRVISGYRSFGEQADLKSQYTVTYGSGANQFSADQGYSEHQLGTTVDFTTPEIGQNFEQIDTTEAYEWLEDNAHEYGFILSYPEGNQYYQYEPWHWRFVGIELAEDLDRRNMHFYDMQQREIDEYLSELFDNQP